MIRRPSLSSFVVAAVFTGIASQTAAQTPANLASGSRVRLVATGVSSRPLIGTILKGDATTIEIQKIGQKGPIVVRRDAITKLEVCLGRRSRGRGAGIGALLGFGIGVIPAFVPESEEPCGSNEFFCRTTPSGQRVQATIVTHRAVGMVFGAIGAGVGALIGAALPPGEKWRAVPTGLRVSVGGAHKRDIGVYWSIAF